MRSGLLASGIDDAGAWSDTLLIVVVSIVGCHFQIDASWHGSSFLSLSACFHETVAGLDARFTCRFHGLAFELSVLPS
jgi:hypothetical protein